MAKEKQLKVSIASVSTDRHHNSSVNRSKTCEHIEINQLKKIIAIAVLCLLLSFCLALMISHLSRPSFMMLYKKNHVAGSVCCRKTKQIRNERQLIFFISRLTRTKKQFFYNSRDLGRKLITKQFSYQHKYMCDFVSSFNLIAVTSRIHRKTLRIASKPGKKAPGKKISFGKNQKVSQLMSLTLTLSGVFNHFYL